MATKTGDLKLFEILRREGKKMNEYVLFGGNYITFAFGIVMYNSLREFENSVTVHFVK